MTFAYRFAARRVNRMHDNLRLPQKGTKLTRMFDFGMWKIPY